MRAQERRPLGSGVEQAGQDLERTVRQASRGDWTFVCAYRYELPDGREWFEKVRWATADGRGKSFTYRWRTKPGWIFHDGKREGADGLLYRLPRLLSAVEAGEPIWWAEGEKDADAATWAGAVATSHHGGAGKISGAQAAWFRGHRGFVVLMYDLDPDDPVNGGNPGALDVVTRYDLLRGVGIQRSQIRVCHARQGKDLADHIEAGHTLHDLVGLSSMRELRVKAARTSASTLRSAGYPVGAP